MPFLTEELFSEINKINRSISDEASWPKFKKIDINFSFGPGGSTETVKCKDCGIKKLRKKR